MKLASRFIQALPKLVLISVLGFALIYAIAWIGLYIDLSTFRPKPHSYRVASEWIFANIPKGSVLAGPHWDDRLPLSIPGKEAPRYYVMEGRDAELPFYERDTKEKLALVLRRMARADYLIFPTGRMVDSLPRVPDEYPYTTRVLQLLWAEKLGFSFEVAIKDRPSFFGLTFNDDLADESISVYDHPKIVVFKNQERLTEEQMAERVLNAQMYEPLPGLNDLLLMDRAGWSKTATIYDPNPVRMAWTFAALLVIGLSAWIVLTPLLRFLPDRGLGVSFMAGLVLCAVLTWVAALAGVVPFNRASAIFFAVVIVGVALLRLLSSGSVREIVFEAIGGHGASVLLTVFCGLTVVVATKILYPDYFWSLGELQSFALAFSGRNEFAPAQLGDQFGSYLMYLPAGWLLKVVGARDAFGYELSFAMLAAGVGGVLYTCSLALLRRSVHALIIMLIALTPVIRGIHVVYNGYSGVDSAQADEVKRAVTIPLREWLSAHVRGAPLVLDGCGQADASRIARTIGLPTPSEQVRSAVCSETDPERVFQGMMSHGIQLLVIPSSGDTLSVTEQEYVGRLTGRSDLFAAIYSGRGGVVVAPAFSSYFPRAYSEAGIR